MKILIIEDEPLVARDLQGMISRLEPGALIAGPLTSVKSCRQWFADNPAPDLVFSDIRLSDGISFEVFEESALSCPIIFTTAYDSFAIRAFKLNSIDYLLKPIETGALETALKKYKSLVSGALWDQPLKDLLQQWKGATTKFKERFLSLHRNTLVPVRTQEIGFFHKDELIFIHTLRNEKLICEFGTLDEVESLLDPAQFFRVNRQYLVHVQIVGRIRTTLKGLCVQLKPPFDKELEISREKAVAFRKWVEG